MVCPQLQSIYCVNYTGKHATLKYDKDCLFDIFQKEIPKMMQQKYKWA